MIPASLLLIAAAVCLGLVVGAIVSGRWREKKAHGDDEGRQEFARQLARAERLNVEVTVTGDDRTPLLQARGQLWQARQNRRRGMQNGE